jgi:glycosyltransferase involved in cell wall biosynthesis
MSWRIAYLDHIPELSGGEIALRHLLQCIDRHRVDPVVALAAEGPFAQRLREDGVAVEILPLSARVRHHGKMSSARDLASAGLGRELVAYTVRIAGWLRRNRVQLVHTNSLKADLYGGMAGRLTGKPVVWHLRDRVDRRYLSPALIRALRLGLRTLPTHVICNSESTRRSIEGIGRAPRTVVPSGVPLPQIETLVPRRVVDGDGPVVGMLARISLWKGQREFVEAAALLRAAHPSARFVVAGAPLFEADRPYEAEVRRLAHERGLDGSLTFTGFVDDVYPVLAGMDVLVHASTIAEPLGKTVLEAMAAARPVVATDLGGVREVVVPGQTGYLVAPGDAAALAGAVDRLLRDPEARRRMGEAGRERVEEHFEVGATTRQVERVYASLIPATQNG